MPKQVALTERQIQKLSKPGRHCVDTATSLYIRIGSTGARAYEVRAFSSNGKRTWKRVGDARVMTLRAAKFSAEKINEAAATKTYRQLCVVAEEYIEHNRDRWTEGTYLQWKQNFRDHINPHIGHMACNTVSPINVADLLRPLIAAKHETARRTRARISTVIKYELARNGKLVGDPAAIDVMNALLPKRTRVVKHFDAPTLDQLKTFLLYLDGNFSSHFALRWLIFSAARTTEVRGMVWSELDLVNKVWSLSNERTKTGTSYRVPITMQMHDVLSKSKSKSGEGLVFPNRMNKTLDINSMRQIVRKQGEVWVPHGVRSTFRVWAAEQGYGEQIAEYQLGHIPKSEVVRAYQRSDLFNMRCEMMQNWANALTDS